MAIYAVKNDGLRQMVINLIRDRDLPFTVDMRNGTPRTLEQNRLAFKWYKEIADQMGDRTPEEVRAECKLEIGVPIMREIESFREKYDVMIRPLPYEHKLAMMVEPFDFAVTRNMTVKQLTRYLDEVQRRWSQRGVVLTLPEAT